MQHAMAPSITREEAERRAAVSCEACAKLTTGVCGPCFSKLTAEVVEAEDEVDMTAKLARLAAVKRQIGTPTQSPTAAPPSTKARGEPALPALPKFPTPVSSCPAAPAPGDGIGTVLPTPADPVLMAIAALTAEVQGMRLETATKKDLVDLRQGMREETRGLISEAVSPLK